MQCLSTAHAFDYLALRINPGLTSCKELVTVMDTSTAVFASKNGKYFPVDIAVVLWKDAIVINMYDGLSNLRSETRLKLLNL